MYESKSKQCFSQGSIKTQHKLATIAVVQLLSCAPCMITTLLSSELQVWMFLLQNECFCLWTYIYWGGGGGGFSRNWPLPQQSVSHSCVAEEVKVHKMDPNFHEHYT